MVTLAAWIVVISALLHPPLRCSGLSPAARRHRGRGRIVVHYSSARPNDSSPDPVVAGNGDQAAAFDVILSSGFLCFSRHAGFASALDDLGLLDRVGRYVGTSSGALAASMLAAGLSADDVAAELSARRPIAQCRPSSRFWRGALSTRSLRRRLEGILPETFEELRTPLAVGVYDVETGEARLVTSGPLAPAVAASCAVPGGMFAPVRLGDDRRLYADGGAVDRTFVGGWREWDATAGGTSSAGGGGRRALVHLISSQEDGVYSERDGIPEEGERDDIIDIVHSPRTAGGLFSLGDFEGERRETRAAVTKLLSGRFAV